MRSLLLVDTSAWSRVLSQPTTLAAFELLRHRHDGMAFCLPLQLELCYSARSAAEYLAMMEFIATSGVMLENNPATAETANRLQERLFHAGKGRSVGVTDLQLAATALAYSNDVQHVTVVHYDGDYEYVATVEPEFRQLWIAPRGTL